MQTYKDYIGVFDSGVGGISVLQELTKRLPNENFLYFGDSANAPYGEKTEEKIMELVSAVAEKLLAEGVKAIVIACNTATSVGVTRLRELYPQIPIIGMEPAIKPATKQEPHRNILVMATSITLRLEKYQELAQKLTEQANIIPLECVGLAQRIEEGNLDGEDLHQKLFELLEPHIGQVDSIVLGCTHYQFVKKQIREVMGAIPLFDGGEGTANELKRRLESHHILQENGGKQCAAFQSSQNTKEELELYRWFYELEIL